MLLCLKHTVSVSVLLEEEASTGRQSSCAIPSTSLLVGLVKCGGGRPLWNSVFFKMAMLVIFLGQCFHH